MLWLKTLRIGNQNSPCCQLLVPLVMGGETNIFRAALYVNYISSIIQTHLVYVRLDCLCQFSVAPANSSTLLETVLKSRNLDEIFKSRDETRDVLVKGFKQSTVTDVKTFFEGVDIDEIHTLESKARPTTMYYVRFNDVDSKQKGLSKHKQMFGSRFIDVVDLKTDLQDLGTFILADSSDCVYLSNLPLVTNKDKVKSWLKIFPVDVKDIHMLQKGSSLVQLDSSEQAKTLLEHNREAMDGKKINMRAFIPRDVLKNFKEKYISK